MNYSEDTDYYAILKISVDADGKAIKSAYRKIIKQLHPDTHKIYDTTEEVALINAAHDVLSNPSKRQEYYNQREDYYTSGAWMDSPESFARLALWNRHLSLLKDVMFACKDQYFAGQAELIENDTQMLIPAIVSPHITLPNMICLGDSEAIGICCHKNAEGFIVAMYLRTALYVADRGYLAPERIIEAVNECIMEMETIKKTLQSP